MKPNIIEVENKDSNIFSEEKTLIIEIDDISKYKKHRNAVLHNVPIATAQKYNIIIIIDKKTNDSFIVVNRHDNNTKVLIEV